MPALWFDNIGNIKYYHQLYKLEEELATLIKEKHKYSQPFFDLNNCSNHFVILNSKIFGEEYEFTRSITQVSKSLCFFRNIIFTMNIFL